MNEVRVLRGRPTEEDIAAVIAVLLAGPTEGGKRVREHDRSLITSMDVPQPRGWRVRETPRLIQRDLTSRRWKWTVRSDGAFAYRQALHAVSVKPNS